MNSPLFCCGIPLVLLLLLTGCGLWLARRVLFYAICAWLGWGKDVGELARRLGIHVEDLRRITPRYSIREIPKRNGGKRKLLVPSPELMTLQRNINQRLLKKLRVHDAAHGFRKGRSIVTNANVHAGRRILIKLDITNFFPSTRAERIEKYFRRVGWNREAASLLTKLVTHEGGLPQGAPTSPTLSNVVNKRLDAELARYIGVRRGALTRYADDITISFQRDYPHRNRGVVQRIRKILKGFGYKLNESKTRILRPHQHKRVTGLVVHGKPKLPRVTRRWLRAVRHRLATTGSATLSAEQIAGWTALEHMIQTQAKEPEKPKLLPPLVRKKKQKRPS